MRRALVTGINGQDGSYLAELLLERGYEVIGLVREDAGDRLGRIQHIRHRLEIVEGSLLDDALLRRVLAERRPNEIYNFAARASSRQLLTDPTLTAEYNGLAVVRLLEAIRAVDAGIRFCQASSSEMFGAATQSPQNELTPFRPRNPYGVAKLFAHGMVGTYRENFGVFGCAAILFNHESPRRGPEFVTRKITMGVARIRAGLTRSLPLGDLDVTRDWGFAGDYVRAMWQMLQAEVADDYVVATGVSHSVREFCDLAFGHVGLDYRAYVQADPGARRAAESVPFVGDAGKARRELGWQPSMSFERLVRTMVDADIVAQQVALAPDRNVQH
ncbi:GDP-mannose 4,6-dehydratase [Steroidobacter agaridevorans]|uniref:GDP-mannose 4,6-dehydratase n=1 Tax=Steroidobacter agaridevorans TaxID=2695856 RepID=A0A829YFY4_9GAMM|nr:GDP-mannose 4,6-dehydratase [Steroidobacter agaridevorans]GFE82130.1 GDP-mannose 4,6-dehydratase [Steroidobacter agaridevorans]GFE85482.1 GDP-mannose 4,6-dehydratase [Steroidobacter agaridevorans]